jgi:hypothetical protein
MANDALLTAVKSIIAAARAGKLDDAYVGYRDLFESPAFATYEPHDQRQAMRLMVHAKGLPRPPPAAIGDAHRAAARLLTELVAKYDDPADYEMLGMCHIVAGDEDRAATVFRAGLTLERQRNAQSDLCGAFMRRISML